MSVLENVVKNLEKSIDNVVSNLVGTANNLQQNQNGLQNQINTVHSNVKKNETHITELDTSVKKNETHITELEEIINITDAAIINTDKALEKTFLYYDLNGMNLVKSLQTTESLTSLQELVEFCAQYLTNEFTAPSMPTTKSEITLSFPNYLPTDTYTSPVDNSVYEFKNAKGSDPTWSLRRISGTSGEISHLYCIKEVINPDKTLRTLFLLPGRLIAHSYINRFAPAEDGGLKVMDEFIGGAPELVIVQLKGTNLNEDTQSITDVIISKSIYGLKPGADPAKMKNWYVVNKIAGKNFPSAAKAFEFVATYVPQYVNMKTAEKNMFLKGTEPYENMVNLTFDNIYEHGFIWITTTWDETLKIVPEVLEE